MELYSKLNNSFNAYNYDKILNEKMNYSEIKSYISSLMTEKENYYMNNLTLFENRIKKLKYIRINYLNENGYFGNLKLLISNL